MNKSIMVSKPSAPPFEEYLKEISDVWDTRMFTNIGPKHEKLEIKLRDYLKVDNIDLFSNGHSALEAALLALDLKGEVITTPFTFASTVMAILRCGLTPIFCDIDPMDYTIDTNLIEALINNRTSAILPVHIYGNICDVHKIDNISKKYNLPVIYDSAHAFGIELDEIGIGNYGDISMFSFHATKVFHTVEGGGLTYKRTDLHQYFSCVRNFGQESNEVKQIGYNMKMSEIHAAMGLCNLKYVDVFIQKRQECYECYCKHLLGIKGLHISKIREGVKSNYSYFAICIDTDLFGESRDSIIKRLESDSIFARKYYHPLVSEFPIYEMNHHLNSTPIAKKISEQIIVLPLYSDLNKNDIERICSVILGKKA